MPTRRLIPKRMFSLASFWRNCAGSTVTIFAIALPVMAMATAGAIEFTEVAGKRNKLQTIADSAALNAARQLGVDPSDATVARAQVWADSMIEPLRGRWSIQANTAYDRSKGSITVKIDAYRSSFFRDLLPPGGFKVNVTATAINAATYPLCVLGLEQGSSQTASLTGASSLTASKCLVQSNGDLSAAGASKVVAGSLRTVGRASGNVTPLPVTDVPAISDPFASIPIEAPSLCTDVSIQLGGGTTTLNPGVHCGNINVLGSGTLQLNPGEHYFTGSVFSLGGNVTLKGTDVVVILKNPLSPVISGNVVISIEGRKSGPLAGFALITDRSFTGTLTISSVNAKKILGTIYLPKATLSVSGFSSKVADQSDWTIVVAKAVSIAQNATLVINSNYAASSVPLPNGVGPGVARLSQ